MIVAARACYRAREWFAGHYNTGSALRQQFVYWPWLISTGLGDAFHWIAREIHGQD